MVPREIQLPKEGLEYTLRHGRKGVTIGTRFIQRYSCLRKDLRIHSAEAGKAWPLSMRLLLTLHPQLEAERHEWGVEHTYPFLFSLGLQPMDWYRPQLGWVGQSSVISLILVLPHTLPRVCPLVVPEPMGDSLSHHALSSCSSLICS